MNIALIGYGQMGKEIEKIAQERGHEIVLIIDKDNHDDLNTENLKKVDVAIEFSRPESAVENYKTCFSNSVPVVSGTTGWLEALPEIISKCEANKTGFFYASNFSLGVNLFFELNKKLAELMNPFKEYSIRMNEIHHTRKLDAPSGTAITLAEGLILNVDHISTWKNSEKVNVGELPIISYREGDVPGTHEVIYNSEIDTISIKHEAKNRKGFALGAVLAAEFLKGKTGFYGMNDLLQIS
jgi:4-hydroxy-tetrahydrodipicolinate reductase